VFDQRGEAVATPIRFLGTDRSFRAANMLEEEASGSELKVLRIGPYEINTIRITLP
jgi:hypothetical protein